MTTVKLPRMQRRALEHAARQTHIWSYTPRSRYSGHWETGCYHHAVINRLVDAGYLVYQPGSFTSGIAYGGGYAITDAGRIAIGITIKEGTEDE
ncbi:MAG: hypothetical protein ABWY36_05405 [Leifsonia sp.]